jgi:hypothetical protein
MRRSKVNFDYLVKNLEACNGNLIPYTIAMLNSRLESVYEVDTNTVKGEV